MRVGSLAWHSRLEDPAYATGWQEKEKKKKKEKLTLLRENLFLKSFWKATYYDLKSVYILAVFYIGIFL